MSSCSHEQTYIIMNVKSREFSMFEVLSMTRNTRYLGAGAKEKTQNVPDGQLFKMIVNIVQHLIVSLVST